MEGFTKIIDILLQEKASLDEAKQLEIEAATKEIEAKYAEHSEKIDTMLTLAGYEEPVEEEAVVEELDEVVKDADLVEEGEGGSEAESGKAPYSI